MSWVLSEGPAADLDIDLCPDLEQLGQKKNGLRVPGHLKAWHVTA